jgi:hypothetical protein
MSTNVNWMEIGGRGISKLSRRCPATGEFHPVWVADPEPGRKGGDIGWSTATTSLAVRFDRLAAQLHAKAFTPEGFHEPALAEVRRIRAMGLGVLADRLASDVGLAEPAHPVGLFDPGEVLLDPLAMAFGLTAIRADLERHVRGDLDGGGNLAGYLEQLTDEIRFCPSLAPHPTLRAAAAVEAGEGVVFSGFGHTLPKGPGNTDPPSSVEIVTVLDPVRGNRTLIAVGGTGPAGLAHD